jgi:ferrous iron transport protein B
MSAIFREVGRNWGLFAAGWTSFLAYGAAVITYQTGSFNAHPASSSMWIAAILAARITVLALMRRMGASVNQALPAVISTGKDER